MFKIGNVLIKNKIICAPMAGVSDISYRKILKEMNPGLMYSEMISIMGIVYDSDKTLDMLKIEDNERPISIQIFGSDEEAFVKAAKYIEENIHPDIIDINMGCPVPKVAVKSQAGSALLKNPERIGKIIKAITSQIKTPITVKIRLGWDDKNINCVEIAKICEQNGASAIALHARTRSQGYSGSAKWEYIKKVKENVHIPVIGNGDIKTIYDAKKMLEETGCDGVMIGRSTLGNPWFIKECIEYVENNNIIDKASTIERIDMIKKHYNLLKENTSQKIAMMQIKTHSLWYLKYIDGTKEIKNKIVNSKTEEEFLKIIDDFRNYCEKTIKNA